jgi:hypothetical protein
VTAHSTLNLRAIKNTLYRVIFSYARNHLCQTGESWSTTAANSEKPMSAVRMFVAMMCFMIVGRTVVFVLCNSTCDQVDSYSVTVFALTVRCATMERP